MPSFLEAKPQTDSRNRTLVGHRDRNVTWDFELDSPRLRTRNIKISNASYHNANPRIRDFKPENQRLRTRSSETLNTRHRDYSILRNFEPGTPRLRTWNTETSNPRLRDFEPQLPFSYNADLCQNPPPPCYIDLWLDFHTSRQHVS